MNEIQFESPQETYLNMNLGDVLMYYRHVAEGNTVGSSFVDGLNALDRYLIAADGRTSALRKVDIVHGEAPIKEAIEFLVKRRTEIPQGHPLWDLLTQKV
jgi:hypothetical protein